MDLVVAPGVIGEDGVGLVLADREADLAAQLHRAFQLAVLVAQEHELPHPDRLARGALLALARGGHLRGRHLRVMRALLTAREHAVRDVCSALDPGRQRAAASEVNVVGMREHGHGALWDRERGLGHV